MRKIHRRVSAQILFTCARLTAAVTGVSVSAIGSLAMASADSTSTLSWTQPLVASMDSEAGAVSAGSPALQTLQTYVIGNLAGDGTLNTINAGPTASGTYAWDGNDSPFSTISSYPGSYSVSAPVVQVADMSVPAGTFDIASPTSYWNIGFQGAANDYFIDQQTGINASDLVGDSTHPVLYRYYDPSPTYGDHTHGMLYFRVRIGGKNSTGSTWGPFDNVLSIGLDFDTPTSPYGTMDMFVMLDVHNPTGKIGVALAGTGANTSPNSTTIGSFITGTTANVVRAINTNIYNFQYVDAADGPLDLESNGATDGWVSFAVPFNYVVTGATQLGLTITDTTPIKWGFGTSTQPNSFNQDVNGTTSGGTSWSTIYTNQNGSVATSVGTDTYHPAIAGAITPNPLNLGNIHAGGTFAPRALTLSNIATDDGFAEKLDGAVGSTTGNATGSGLVSLLPAGSSNSTGISVGLGGTSTGGAKTGTVSIDLASDGTGTSDNGQTALSPQTIAVSGYVYNYAAAAASQTVTMRAHVGQAASAPLTLSNVAPADPTYTETLSTTGFSGTTSGFTAGGSASGIAGGSSGSGTLRVGVDGTLTPGSHSGSTTLGLRSDEVNGSGLGNTNIGSQTITINAQIYSGLSTWSGAATSSWNDFSNWDSLGGVPGIDGALSQGHDTATFSDGGLARNTVTLDGTSPQIKSLSLTASGSYTIAQGSGGALIMSGSGAAINVSGDQTISAPVQLAAGTQVNVAGISDRLTISGQLQNIGDLTKTGLGALALTNTNSATGSIIINGGDLRLEAGASVAGNVAVNANAWLQGSGTVNKALQLNDNGGVSPGGDIAIGALTIATDLNAGTSHLAGGNYRLEIAQMTGSSGSQDLLRGSGFDALNVGGVLAIDATAANKFTVDVRSLTLTQSAEGALAGWDPSREYRWTILQANGGIIGFDPAAFTFDTTAFYADNTYLLGGHFEMAVSPDQKSLIVTYAVPEPGIVLTLSSVIVGGCWLRPRRRPDKEPKLLAWRTDEKILAASMI